MLRRRSLAVFTTAAFALLGFSAAQADSAQKVVGQSQASPPPAPGRGTPPDDPGRGMVWAGISATNGGSCGRGYATKAGDWTVCTHGPDPAAPGVNAHHRPSTADLYAAATATGTTAASTGGIPCYGDGISGNRVQAVYVHAVDVADRYDSIASLIPGWAANVDNVFNSSAAETGAVRHVRFVTDASCNLDVARVQLSVNGDDSLSNTITELRNLGFNRTDRKYLVWSDASVYCGIAGISNDDRATSYNANNVGPSYARVDSGCWGSSAPVEAHELMHNLGGVQLSAPHSSGGWHCTDESDRMCYPDASGVTMTQVCPSSHEGLFDCNHDDYFHTAPPSGSYLAGHWNSANSSFLEVVDPTAWGGGTTSTTSSSTTTTTTTSTSTTTTTTKPTSTTTTFSGSFNKRSTSRSYTVSAGSGTVNGTLTFSKASSMSVTVKDATGASIGSGTGGSPVGVTATTSGGTVTFVVTGGTTGTYTLSVTYPTP